MINHKFHLPLLASNIKVAVWSDVADYWLVDGLLVTLLTCDNSSKSQQHHTLSIPPPCPKSLQAKQSIDTMQPHHGCGIA